MVEFFMRKRLAYFILFSLLAVCSSLRSQVCNGSLGENIFTDGDFGSGPQTIFPTNPQLAPGYAYTTNVPIMDGFYQLTNFSGGTGQYGTWLRIGDNSSDPDGYFMMVNASFSPGIFYEKIVDNLCPNTFYEFSADVINMITRNTTGHLLPNVQFLLDDEVKYSTGDIGQTETWNTYGFTFTTGDNQTSIKLTLRNNAPGGIGNDLGLDNITFRPCGPQSFIGIDSDTTIFLCEEGDPFNIQADILGADGQQFSIQWQRSQDNGISWVNVGIMNEDVIVHDIFIPGNYDYRYLSAADDDNLLNSKCRVISDIIKITVLPKTSSLRDSTCVGTPYVFGDNQLTQSGMYIDTFVSSRNCDSIVFLDLLVLEDPNITFDIVSLNPSCVGYEDGTIEVSNIQNGFTPYQFYVNDNLADRSVNQLPQDDYTITVVDRYGCRNESPVVLTDPELFVIQTIENQSVLLGDEIQVTTISNYPLNTVTWNNGAGLSCTNCENPLLIPYDNGEYVITATNMDGCIARDSFNVMVDKQALFFIPNIFTPNDDGLNDVFFMSSYKSSVQVIDDFYVYDRWGNIAYEAHEISGNDLNVGWNPDRNATDGVYTYVIRTTLIDGSVHHLTGNLTLIR